MDKIARTDIDRILTQESVCYVLITCTKPSKDGQMNVEMTYGGDDPVLASYLLQGAQEMMDDKLNGEEPIIETPLRVIKGMSN
jgi:hypothetical protein